MRRVRATRARVRALRHVLTAACATVLGGVTVVSCSGSSDSAKLAGPYGGATAGPSPFGGNSGGPYSGSSGPIADNLIQDILDKSGGQFVGVYTGSSGPYSGAGGPYTPPSGGGGSTPPPSGGGGSGITVSSFLPTVASTAGNEPIGILGTGFSAFGTMSVTFNGVAGTVTAVNQSGSPQSLIVSTPLGMSPGLVTIRVTNGQGQTATLANAFMVYAQGTSNTRFNFVAGSDKWLVVFQGTGADADNNGIADLQEALATAVSSTGGTFQGQLGTATDLILSFASLYYRNNGDGTLGSSGVPVSFKANSAPALGAAPPASTAAAPNTVNDFNVMVFRKSGQQNGVVGRAIQDGPASNALLENNQGLFMSDAAQPLGIITDEHVRFWNGGAIATSLRTLPEFSQELAATLAHEVGHSIGLLHNESVPTAPNTVNMMSAQSVLDPANLYAFDDITFAALRSWMPGTGRRVHPTAFTLPSQLLRSHLVVVATPLGVQGERLRFRVDEVLSGAGPAAGEELLLGHGAQGLDPARVTSLGQLLLFLMRDDQGRLFPVGEADVVRLAGRDLATWRRALADCGAELSLAPASLAESRALTALRRSRALGGDDAQLRAGALLELAWDREACRALGPDERDRVLRLLRDGTGEERLRAAQLLLHRQDAGAVEDLLDAVFREDEAAVQRAVAGALEMTLGLEQAAARVRQRAAFTPLGAAAGRARVALGWLRDAGSVDWIARDLGDADPLRAQRAAEALGRIQHVSALAALEETASDAARPQEVRLAALRAIASVGTLRATHFLERQASSLSGELQRAAEEGLSDPAAAAMLLNR